MRTLKDPFASRLSGFKTTLKLLRITDQWYIVPVKFRFGQNLDFLALLLLPLAGGPKDWKHFDADWRLISSASFHTSSDNCERNTQKWNGNNKDCKKETIETNDVTEEILWRGASWSRMFCNDALVNFVKWISLTADKIKQTGATCLEKLVPWNHNIIFD